VLSEAVFRAIHTLSGSSKMAEARHGIRVTEPLNHVMRKAYDSGQGLSDEGLATLADAVSAIDNVVSHINESTGFFTDHASLLERLHHLEVEIDAHDRASTVHRDEFLGDHAGTIVVAEPARTCPRRRPWRTASLRRTTAAALNESVA
jgi:chemotaxis protein histidine kinase CheA